MRASITSLLLFLALKLAAADPDTVISRASHPVPQSGQVQVDSSLVRMFGDLDRETVESIRQIYEVYLGSLTALVKSDALETERLLMASLELIQGLMEDVPEVQNNRRFQLLYKTVINEYNDFYGIAESNEAEGEVFSFQSEIFSEDDDAPVDFTLPESITVQKFQVPLIRNQYVMNHVFYLAHRRPEIMEKWLERSEFYFPMMQKIFKEEGVPVELIHLSMIESGLVASAKSKAKAVGLWQFIVATGSMYGLESNYWLDERRDPEKATRAAARHLRDLYNVWGDWHLALANYNVSPRRMKWAVAKSKGVRNYWVIYPYLPRETRGYVPSYIAATLIATNPESFGFKKYYGRSPYQYEVVEVPGSMRLDVLAKCAGISTDSLSFWNPELIRWATPPGINTYPLKLPAGIKTTFVENLAAIPENERRPVAMHIVKKGETLGIIANKYGTSVKDLFASNNGLKSTLKVGQEIIIPVQPGSGIKISANMPSGVSRTDSGPSKKSGKNGTKTPALAGSGEKRIHTVRSGETISRIAELYGVPAWRVREWNGTSNLIRTGQKLVIYTRTGTLSQTVSATKAPQKPAGQFDRYTVKSNDNLYEIAIKFGMKLEELKRVNNLKSNRIYPGQVLYVNPR